MKLNDEKVQLDNNVPKLWTVGLQNEFDDLAAKYVLDEITLLDEARLAELISLRRKLKYKRTPQDQENN